MKRKVILADKWDRMSRRQAEQFQGAALREFIAEQIYPFSPHYRRVFDEAGLKPRDIRSLSDLSRIPFTTKSDLVSAETGERRFRDWILQPDEQKIRGDTTALFRLEMLWRRFLLGSRALKEDLGREYRPAFVTFTTGRTADPIPFFYTLYDLELFSEVGRRLADVVNIDPAADRGINAFPFAQHLAFWQVVYCGTASGMLMLHTGGGRGMGTDAILAAIERTKGTILMGIPGYVYHLLREGKQRNADLSTLRLVFVGGDRLTPGGKRRMIELLSDMGAQSPQVISVYGFTESRSCWAQCPSVEPTGYHLYPDMGITEIVDPDSGEPVGEGQTGEVVYTSLDWRGSAVLRYRTGDIAVGGITWEKCPGCGRTCPRLSADLQRVSNRLDMQLTKLKGTLVDLNRLSDFLTNHPRVEEWQVEIGKINDDPAELDELVLRVAPRGGGEGGLAEALASEIQAKIEVRPNRVELMELSELNERLGMDSQLKEKRIVRREPNPV